MGLDLFHDKVSHQSDGSTSFYEAEYFTNSPEFLRNNKDLLHTLTHSCDFFDIKIFPDDESVAKYRGIYPNDKTIKLVGELSTLEKKFREIETYYNLDPSDKFIMSGQFGYPMTAFMSYLQVSYAVGFRTFKGLYFTNEGLMEKCMISEFRENFRDDILYTKKEDVIRAAGYLDLDYKYADEVLKEFQTTFIDNFEEGKSIFHTSW
ncbi:hypothetical protein [Chitinophaga sp. Cy-1792]|uniref:hypothetical protein n=1 Tax=Chitinophaga sp. Cy-1792 TaxID=2608339 RepID=UPI0014223E4A|nr:hypothetical protein [Chitinophaga sp. Cy-1792]NIG53413.1 hypothetical protein [Chitinophaga sp. Cy-1792]